MENYLRIGETTLNSIERKTIRDVKLKGRRIFHTIEFKKELQPGEIEEKQLFATKLLVNTNEIDLNNDAEIIEVERKSIKNRNITKILTSQFYDRGEMVTITPPTGSNKIT